MPNRYEREIEEILRNLEQTDPKPGLGQRFNGRLRRKPAPRIHPRQQSRLSFSFSLQEWLLLITVLLALIAGGYAFTAGGPSIITGILATAGVVCILLVALSQFLFRPRRQSVRRGNITITPLRRGPLNNLKTQWNLLRLRLRYRRRSPKE